MPKEKDKLQVTGSLLQDVTIPKLEEMEGTVDLFLGGDLPSAQPVDPTDAEVNKFLRGE